MFYTFYLSVTFYCLGAFADVKSLPYFIFLFLFFFVNIFRPRSKNMINKIIKERRRSMNAAPTRPSNKSQWQGAQGDTKRL
jgi:hypothetical protein